MPRLSVTLISTFLLLPLLPAQRGDRGGRGEAPKLAHFTYEEGVLKSDKVRTGEAGYGIYLPKGYADEANKDTKYPSIVWLHGFGGPDEFQNDGGATVLDALRGQDKIPPLVMIVFRGPGRRTTYMNGEAAGDVEDLITGALVEQVAQKYRVSTKRKHRAVMGVSAGGFGALKIAMRHPEVFGTVAVHSAAILPADPADLAGSNEQMVQRMLRGGLAQELGDPIDKAKWQAHMPMALAASKKPEELKGLHVYFDAGTEDRYGFCEPNEALDKALTENGHKHLFRKVEEGGHAWSSPSMKECLAVSLQFVGAAFLGKDPIEAVAPKAKAEPADVKKDEKKGGEEPKKGDAKQDEDGGQVVFDDASLRDAHEAVFVSAESFAAGLTDLPGIAR